MINGIKTNGEALKVISSSEGGAHAYKYGNAVNRVNEEVGEGIYCHLILKKLLCIHKKL
jgi:hypothetical protein